MKFYQATAISILTSSLIACGSGDEDSPSARFQSEDIPGLYQINTSEGNYTLRFEKTEEGDQVGYTLDTDAWFENSLNFFDIGEDFTWHVDLDGIVTINLPDSSTQARLTKIEAQEDFDLIRYEIDSDLNDDFDRIENNAQLSKITPDEPIEEHLSLNGIEEGIYKLSTSHGDITYTLTNILANDQNPFFFLGLKNNETVIWFVYSDIIAQSNAAAVPAEEGQTQQEAFDAAYARNQKLIGNVIFLNINGFGGNEIIALIDGNSTSGTVQYSASLPINLENRFGLVINDATWEKQTVSE